jgi:hypothetical protein
MTDLKVLGNKHLLESPSIKLESFSAKISAQAPCGQCAQTCDAHRTQWPRPQPLPPEFYLLCQAAFTSHVVFLAFL